MIANFVSLLVVVLSGAIGLIYGGIIGGWMLFMLALGFSVILTSKLWVCPACGTPFKQGGFSGFTAKISGQAACAKCRLSVKELKRNA